MKLSDGNGFGREWSWYDTYMSTRNAGVGSDKKISFNPHKWVIERR